MRTGEKISSYSNLQWSVLSEGHYILQENKTVKHFTLEYQNTNWLPQAHIQPHVKWTTVYQILEIAIVTLHSNIS